MCSRCSCQPATCCCCSRAAAERQRSHARVASSPAAPAGEADAAVQRHYDQQGGQAAACLLAKPCQGGGELGRSPLPPQHQDPFPTGLGAGCWLGHHPSHDAGPSLRQVATKYSTVETLRQQYMFVPAKYKVSGRRGGRAAAAHGRLFSLRLGPAGCGQTASLTCPQVAPPLCL